MIVMKFGGSSVGSGKRMRRVAEIIKRFDQEEDVVVIVSAMQGVTDSLIELFRKYKLGRVSEGKDDMQKLREIHKQALDDLNLPKEICERMESTLSKLFGRLNFYMALHDDFSFADYDYVVSFGERLSSHLLTAALMGLDVPAKGIDAVNVIVTNGELGNAKAFLDETAVQAKKKLLPLISRGVVPVVTGFYAGSKSGNVVTLGRGGSDYSATILAYALDAEEVILWKEVDGVYSCDPKKDEGAKFHEELSYREALILAKNGAKILHPEAMKPVASKGITVRVKNTFKPEFAGTKIWKGME